MRLKLRARLPHGSVRGRTPRRASGRTAPRRAALGSRDTGGLGPRMGPGRRAHRARSRPPRPPLALPDAGPRELSLCAGESGGWGVVPWILASKHFHSHTHTHTLTRLHSHAAGPLPGMPPPPPQLPGWGGGTSLTSKCRQVSPHPTSLTNSHPRTTPAPRVRTRVVF